MGDGVKDLASIDGIGEELVRVALGASQHLPVLVWAYFGPPEWLEEARRTAEPATSLLARANRLRDAAEKSDDAFIAAQADAIACQLEVMLGASISYLDQARRLLGIPDPTPHTDALEELKAEVVNLASQVVGGADPVRRWEREMALTGEAKWDAAVEAYLDGRHWLKAHFPVAISEDLELGRDSEYHSSVHMNWRSGLTMRLSVNVNTPRTRQSTRFEVAHNGYPGDYLRIAALDQYSYRADGYLPACIKLKNAPESVISEGIEDVAYLRMVGQPSPEELLASRLEWLRRGVAAIAAVMVRERQASAAEVTDYCSVHGFMAEDRIANELRLIDHPVWGVYRAAYWPGRELIMEADRRGARAASAGDYLKFLYTRPHLPATMLADLDRYLDQAQRR